MVIYWVTSRHLDHHDRTPTGLSVVPPSKSGDPESSLVESRRRSKHVLKLGRPKQDTPTGLTSMQVSQSGSLFPRLDELSFSCRRSRSLPNESKIVARSRLRNQSTSCRKYAQSHETAIMKCVRRIVLPDPIHRRSLQSYPGASIPLTIPPMLYINVSPFTGRPRLIDTDISSFARPAIRNNVIGLGREPSPFRPPVDVI